MKKIKINGKEYMEEEPSDSIKQNQTYVPLHCPFCGKKAKAVHHHIKANYLGMKTTFNNFTTMQARTLWNVRCMNSKCTVMPFTKLEQDKNKTIEKWNTRHRK